MNSNSNSMKVKKEFNSLPKGEIVRFSNEFTNEFFLDKNNEMLDVPIDAIRIVFKIASDLRNSQFQNDNTTQLSLFDNEFLNEHNTFATFTINLNDISLNKNTARVKKALEFLVDFKKAWYKTKNSEGKEVKSYGGLITSPSYTKGSTSFLVSSYWLSKLSYINQYNKSLFRLAFNVSNNKHILFFFWLVTLKDTGTQVNYRSINKRYKLNYPNAKELCKFFLKSVQKSLNRESLLSFNFSYKGDLISIQPYKLSNMAIDDPKVKKTLVVSQKTHYWKRQHKLKDSQVKTLATVLKNDKSSIHLFETAYKAFVKEARKEGKKTTSYISDEFMKKFQTIIIDCYKTTKAYERVPNGFPKII